MNSCKKQLYMTTTTSDESEEVAYGLFNHVLAMTYFIVEQAEAMPSHSLCCPTIFDTSHDSLFCSMLPRGWGSKLSQFEMLVVCYLGHHSRWKGLKKQGGIG